MIISHLLFEYYEIIHFARYILLNEILIIFLQLFFTD